MTKGQPIANESVKSEDEVLREQPLSPTPIDHILQRLSCMELPAKEHFERYMHHKWRLNHKPRTLASSFTSVMLFLDFYGKSGKRAIEKIERVDLEGFIEHEQDRSRVPGDVVQFFQCFPFHKSHPPSPFNFSRVVFSSHSLQIFFQLILKHLLIPF